MAARFQSPRCRGSRCGAGEILDSLTECPEFQSPRCRGSRCGDPNAAKLPDFVLLGFNPLGVGAVGAGVANALAGLLTTHVSIPSVSGQSVRAYCY